MERIFSGLLVLVLMAGTAWADARVFNYVSKSGDEDVRILIIQQRALIINPGTRDQMVADFETRDITVAGPGGGKMSLRDMAQQLGHTPATPSAGGTEDKIKAMIGNLPAHMKPLIDDQLAGLTPKEQEFVLKTMMNQLGISDMSGALAGSGMAKPQPADIGDTGRTRQENGHTLREVVIASDRIWMVDASVIEGGDALNEGLRQLSDLVDEVAGGLPMIDSSFFQVGKIDGEVPYHVVAEDGEEFRYEGTDLMSLPDAQVYLAPN